MVNLNNAEALARWKYGPAMDLSTAKERRRMLQEAEIFIATLEQRPKRKKRAFWFSRNREADNG